MSHENLILLALFLFGIGAIGVTIRRNALVVLMCIELMLNAVNILAISFDYFHQAIDGSLLVIFVITVAAIEAAVGLALIVYVYRKRASIDLDEISEMKG